MTTTEQYIEKNKIIADFIDLSFNVNEFTALSEYDFMAVYANLQYWDERDSDFDLNPYKFLKFSTSWDWIIPVWSKWIGYIYSERMKAHPNKLVDHEIIRGVELSFRTAIFENSKTDAFKQLVTAIEWYNSRKNEPTTTKEDLRS